MLGVRDLSVDLDGTRAVVEASLDVPDGEVLAVLGPSGCGKSTLLRALAGLETPRTGRITWDDRDVTGTPTHKRGFVLMFQDGQLFDHYTVARNVGYALRLRRAGRVEERVTELLELVGLPGYAERMPGTLSGGERQRVALARSLAVEPRLLLLDEPLSALDAGLRQRLAGDLRGILREAGTTALLVTHDHDEAFAVADRLAVMRAGRIVQQGAIEEVWRAPADTDTALFLGYAAVLDGEPAAIVRREAGLPAGGAVALRRSALAVDESGTIPGRVVSSRLTPEQVRLRVDVPGLGELDAVARLDAHPATGEEVALRVDRTRLAPVGGP
ncbi:ABC transporter ATP-binding protein [Nocardioides coralli]|uniref:ABC transporter ATP-binding protein n=1 Tax=Nocardioides coralli TaxID=2872154 RepID=UPI001CA418C1|nr:ABC transporter ATP-binding protein [Nocardioides coralli]QZY29398.1 ABC transporter ATP-binding protein [Nocardioides coralli]